METTYRYSVVDYMDGQMKYSPVIVRCDEQGEAIVYFGRWSKTREEANDRLDFLREARSYER